MSSGFASSVHGPSLTAVFASSGLHGSRGSIQPQWLRGGRVSDIRDDLGETIALHNTLSGHSLKISMGHGRRSISRARRLPHDGARDGRQERTHTEVTARSILRCLPSRADSGLEITRKIVQTACSGSQDSPGRQDFQRSRLPGIVASPSAPGSCGSRPSGNWRPFRALPVRHRLRLCPDKRNTMVVGSASRRSL